MSSAKSIMKTKHHAVLLGIPTSVAIVMYCTICGSFESTDRMTSSHGSNPHHTDASTHTAEDLLNMTSGLL